MFKVQRAPFFVLPRVAGEERGGGLNFEPGTLNEKRHTALRGTISIDAAITGI
jgi:hypothetical protein